MAERKRGRAAAAASPPAARRKRAREDSEADDSDAPPAQRARLGAGAGSGLGLGAGSDKFYGNLHREMLQFFTAKGVDSENECKKYFDMLKGTGLETKGQSFDEVIRVLNDNLRFMKLQIKNFICELDGGMYYCLINNLPEEKKDLSKLCSTLTEHEVQYFKILLDDVMKHHGRTSMSHARDLVVLVPGPKWARSKTDACLQTLIDQHWLSSAESKAGEPTRIGIGVRSYAELSKYLEDGFNLGWTTQCRVCKLPCYFGSSCAVLGNESCKVKMHTHCAGKWFGAGAPKCPECNTAWKH